MFCISAASLVWTRLQVTMLVQLGLVVGHLTGMVLKWIVLEWMSSAYEWLVLRSLLYVQYLWLLLGFDPITSCLCANLGHGLCPFCCCTRGSLIENVLTNVQGIVFGLWCTHHVTHCVCVPLYQCFVHCLLVNQLISIWVLGVISSSEPKSKWGNSSVPVCTVQWAQ